MFPRNKDQKMPLYYAQSKEVHRLLVDAGAIDLGHRDVRNDLSSMFRYTA